MKKSIVAGLLSAACVLIHALPAQAQTTDSYAQTKYPIVLVHGLFGFDSVGPVDYFFGVASALKASGATVYTTRVSGANDNETRGEQLLAELRRLQASYGYTKFNLVAHSQGGPTARYVAAVAPGLIASVTSVGSPNAGTPVADDILAQTSATGTTSWVASVANGFENLVNLISGKSALPQNSAAALRSLTTSGSAAFTARYPDGAPTSACGSGPELVHGVRYYSAAGTSVLTNLFDPSDALLALTSVSFKGAPSDGLVGRCSAHWGTVLRDDYPWNHLDEVNQVFGLRGVFTPDPVAFYRTQANRLKARRPVILHRRSHAPRWFGADEAVVGSALVAIVLALAYNVWKDEPAGPGAFRLCGRVRNLGSGCRLGPPESSRTCFDRAAASGAADGTRSIASIRAGLFERGSLRGADLDGGWALDGSGLLRPAIGVRRRFDQLLTGLGEATADELARLLRAQATADLGPAGRIRCCSFGRPISACSAMPTPTTPTRARRRPGKLPWTSGHWLAGRLSARPGADAFLSRGRAGTFRTHIDAALNPSAAKGPMATAATAAEAGQSLPASADRPAAGADLVALRQRRVADFGAEAADRLAAEDAAQRAWDQRLADAAARVADWQHAPELSPAQRTTAIDGDLATHFDPSEQLRVRAVLKLPPPGG